jgi:hypothetical protein
MSAPVRIPHNGGRKAMLKALAVLSLSVLVALGLMFVTTRVAGAPGQSRWVAWGGHAFGSRQEFAEWLRSRGLSYKRWAENHPRAAARLQRRPVAP